MYVLRILSLIYSVYYAQDASSLSDSLNAIFLKLESRGKTLKKLAKYINIGSIFCHKILT